MTGREENSYQTPGEKGEDIFPQMAPKKMLEDNFSGRTSLVYDGFIKLWKVRRNGHEIVETRNSVGCLVYNHDRRSVILVRQSRFFNPPQDGISIPGELEEVLAGHIETGKLIKNSDDAIETIIREAKEELGIDHILPSDIELLNGGLPLFLSPGVLTERMWLGYLEISDDQIESEEREFGLASENESIERVWIPIEDLPRWVFTDMKTIALVLWFLLNKYPQLMKK